MPSRRTNPTDGTIVKSFVETSDARAFAEFADAADRSIASLLRQVLHAYVVSPELRRLVREYGEVSQDAAERSEP